MHYFLINLLVLTISSISANTGGGHIPISSQSSAPTNDLNLSFGHQINTRENIVIIYFDISNSTLKEYRYYYYDLRPFGSYSSNSEFLPRQRLRDTHNSLRIVGLHEGDYISCLSFVDEYETIFKPRYACYEFTLGEKIVGSHHGSKSGYLAPLLFAVAFIIHVFIAIVHHIKAKNYAHKLLHRFIDVTPKSARRKINVNHSLRELDHPHVSASVQRRLSRVTIDANYENGSNHGGHFLVQDPNDELPLYTLPYHSRRASLTTMQVIPEYTNANPMDSVSSIKHLLDSAPWIKRPNRSVTSSIRRTSQLHV
jgi:hypothetical protein